MVRSWKKIVPFALTLSLGTVVVAFFFSNCSSFTAAPATTTTTQSGGAGCSELTANANANLGPSANVIPITMSNIGLNQPTVSVTVCTPCTNQCQVIDNILLDTGSTGLRLFNTALSVPLTQLGDQNGNEYAECYQFGSAIALWGPIQTADVYIGGVRASNVTVQVANSNFASVPNDCSDLYGESFEIMDQSSFGYNGLMGIQPFSYDCGTNCTPDSTAAIYYSCSGNNCSDVTMPESLQVPNPVAALPLDNNGFAIQLPNISSSGANADPGAELILGISTQANNIPSPSVTALPTDDVGNISTMFQGNMLNEAFIDSGSWDFAFSDSGIKTCNASVEGSSIEMYCPTSPVSLSAQLYGASGTGSSVNVNFQVMSGATAWENWPNTYIIYNDIADPGSGLPTLGGSVNELFDWGLPLFFGRTIYFGMDNANVSGLGQGPFNAL